jgi:hypothetical protein
MSDAYANQIYDGARNCTFKLTDVSDGSGLSAQNVTNVGSLVPNPGVHLKVRKIRFAISGMSVRLQWAATTPADIVILNPGEDILDFSTIYSSGISNNGGAGATGDILLTTIGATANANFTIVIEAIKGV